MSGPRGYLLPDGLTADRFVAEVARGFDLSVDDLRGRSRKRHLLPARACAMAVVRHVTDWSLPQIGRYFGGRDHTTVMHHIAKVTADPEMSRTVERVVEAMRPPPTLFSVPKQEAM